MQCVCIKADNLEKIRSAQRPTTKVEVISFFELANYFCAHIPSLIVELLSDLKRDVQTNKVCWGQAQEKAFTYVQKCLIKKSICVAS